MYDSHRVVRDTFALMVTILLHSSALRLWTKIIMESVYNIQQNVTHTRYNIKIFITCTSLDTCRFNLVKL